MKISRHFTLTIGLLTLALALSSQSWAEHQPGHGSEKHDLGAADTNQDGNISLDEFKAAHAKRLEAVFKRLDSNSDGVIDQSERAAAKEKMKAMREKRKGGANPAE